MAFGTYAELQTEVQAWLDRTDLAAKVPDFIALAEARLRRTLEAFEQEARATVTASGRFVTLPNDFDRMRHVHVTLDGALHPLRQMEYGAMNDLYQFDTSLRPQAFAIVAGRICLAPAAPESGLVLEMVYSRGLPSLSVANPTNWLLQQHPDIYLYATLAHAEIYGWNDDRVRLVKPALDEFMAELERSAWDSRVGAAPVAPVIRRTK